jgi:hypothetical protein
MFATAGTPATAGSQQQQDQQQKGRQQQQQPQSFQQIRHSRGIVSCKKKSGNNKVYSSTRDDWNIRGANNIRMDARTFGNTSSRRDVHCTVKIKDASNIGDASNSRHHKNSWDSRTATAAIISQQHSQEQWQRQQQH